MIQQEIEKKLLAGTQYDYSNKPNKYLSASEVGADILKLYLSRKYKLPDTEISQATIGTFVHKGIEHIIDEEYVEMEKSFEVKIPGTNYYATSTIDYIDVKNKVIIDWKTTKLNTGKKIKELIKNNDLLNNDYILQLNHQLFTIGNELGYKLFLGMFYKDAGLNYRTGEYTKSFELIEIPRINEDDYLMLIQDKVKVLDEYVSNDIVPNQCSDLWFAKIKGKTIPSKCLAYCGVNSVCPYYKPDNIDQTMKW